MNWFIELESALLAGPVRIGNIRFPEPIQLLVRQGYYFRLWSIIVTLSRLGLLRLLSIQFCLGAELIRLDVQLDILHTIGPGSKAVLYSSAFGDDNGIEHLWIGFKPICSYQF